MLTAAHAQTEEVVIAHLNSFAKTHAGREGAQEGAQAERDALQASRHRARGHTSRPDLSTCHD